MAPFALPELQGAFAAHLLGEDRADLEAAIEAGAIAASGRLAIYRNHVRISLTAALAATFPVVQRLVGEAFFAGVARGFIQRSPPAGPVLAEYGVAFAQYLGELVQAAALPYLADVARLEWALNAAYAAPRPPALQARDLSGIDADAIAALRLRLQPGVVLLRSAWPIDRIWLANQQATEVAEIALDAGGVRLLVLRREDDAAFVSLTPGEAAFIDALGAEATLEDAAQAAGAATSEFELGGCLARLLAIEALARLS